jgi:WD40 repeat protein
MALSPTGKILACTHNDSIQLFDSETSKKIRQLEVPTGGLVKALAITPDDKKLLAVNQGECSYGTWTPASSCACSLRAYPASSRWPCPPTTTRLRWPRKGLRFRFGTSARAGELFPVSGHDFPVTSVACSADGKTMAYVGRSSLGKPQGLIVLVDALKGERIGELPKNAQFLALSANGKYLAAGELRRLPQSAPKRKCFGTVETTQQQIEALCHNVAADMAGIIRQSSTAW